MDLRGERRGKLDRFALRRGDKARQCVDEPVGDSRVADGGSVGRAVIMAATEVAISLGVMSGRSSVECWISRTSPT